MHGLNKFFNECKKQNIILVKKNLSIQTFSNVSVRIDRKFFTIKPSGVVPSKIKIKDCPVIRISDGKKVKGMYNPSTDTPNLLLHGLNQVSQYQFMELPIRITGLQKFQLQDM